MDDLCSPPKLSVLPETQGQGVVWRGVPLQSAVSRDDLGFHGGGSGLVNKT